MKKTRISGNYFESFAMNVFPFCLLLFFSLCFVKAIRIGFNRSFLNLFGVFLIFLIIYGAVDVFYIFSSGCKSLFAMENSLLLDGQIVQPSNVDCIVSTFTGQGWSREVWFVELNGQEKPIKVLTKINFPLFGFRHGKFKSPSTVLLLDRFPELKAKVEFCPNQFTYLKKLKLRNKPGCNANHES